jgi:hypothetical protein
MKDGAGGEKPKPIYMFKNLVRTAKKTTLLRYKEQLVNSV